MGQSSKSSETPAHPSWISRFCGDQSGGGWREVLCESEETCEAHWENGWMDGWIYWGMGDQGMWQGQWGAGADSSASQSLTDWRSEADNSSIHSKRQTLRGFFFHSQWQHRSRSWLRGLNHLYTDNVPLWYFIQPCGAIQSLVFLCPLCTQIKLAWSKSQQIKTYFTDKLQKNWS